MKAHILKVLLVFEDKVVGCGRSRESKTLLEKIYEELGSDTMRCDVKADKGIKSHTQNQ